MTRTHACPDLAFSFAIVAEVIGATAQSAASSMDSASPRPPSPVSR